MADPCPATDRVPLHELPGDPLAVSEGPGGLDPLHPLGGHHVVLQQGGHESSSSRAKDPLGSSSEKWFKENLKAFWDSDPVISQLLVSRPHGRVVVLPQVEVVWVDHGDGPPPVAGHDSETIHTSTLLAKPSQHRRIVDQTYSGCIAMTGHFTWTPIGQRAITSRLRAWVRPRYCGTLTLEEESTS